MPRKPADTKTTELKRNLRKFLSDFEKSLSRNDLREKVLALVGTFHQIRSIGSSLIPKTVARSARDRILHYFLKYPLTVIHGDELMVVSGIQDWPRRVRELRVQFGWQIASGYTLKEMAAEGEAPEGIDAAGVKPEEYVLLSTDQDRDIAHRWAIANDIRREAISTKERILKFLRANVGRNVSGEEIRYVAKNSTEWARRLRELRTEEGWPVVTRFTGDPEMPAGFYRLERDRQEPAHDRVIPDKVRSQVLERDHYRCTRCGWDRSRRTPDDPRQFLELHHSKPHAEGGKNSADNLVVLCNVCHDDIHAGNGK
jgi:hypothetical protein